MKNYSNKIMAAYLRDPRVAEAQRRIEEGTSAAPVSHPIEALARVAKAGLGGYQMGNIDQEYNTRSSRYSTDMGNLSKALSESETPYQSALDYIAKSGNPDLDGEDYVKGYAAEKTNDRRMNQQMQMQQNQFEQQRAMSDAQLNRTLATQEALAKRQMELEQWKVNNDPAKAFMADLLRGNSAPPSLSSAAISAPSNPPPPMQSAPTTPVAPAAPAAIDARSALLNAALGKQIGAAPEGQMWVRGENGGIATSPIPNYQKKLNATEQKELFDKMDLVNSGNEAENALNYAKGIIEKGNPFTGMGAETLAAANRIPVVGGFIPDDRATATTLAKNAVSEQALNQLKTIFGGMPTEGERAVLLKLQALPEYTKQEQIEILKRATDAVKRRVEFNKNVAEGIRTGGYKQSGFEQQSPLAAFNIDEYLKGIGK